MLPPEQLACIHIAFDSHRLVADAGLFSRMPLAHHPGLGGLVNRHVDPEIRRVGPMREAKLLTLVASGLARGDCIDDADCPHASHHSLSSAGSSRMMPGGLSKSKSAATIRVTSRRRITARCRRSRALRP